MTPSQALILLVALTACAYAVDVSRRRRYRRQVRRLAAEWGMNFGRTDTLRLTPKVARYFPVIGAARVRVNNVIYTATDDRYRYVFTADYTAGVIHGKRRMIRVGVFDEPRDRDRGGPPGRVILAPPELSLIEQYRRLGPGGVGGVESRR